MLTSKWFKFCQQLTKTKRIKKSDLYPIYQSRFLEDF
jgi:hypothetical protein